MSINHLKGIIKKEFIQLRRDRRLFPIIIFAPLFQLFLFGYAVSLDINNVPIVVMDESNDSYSKEIILSLTSSGYFTVENMVHGLKDMEYALERGVAKAALLINDDRKLNIFIDGSDNNTASIIEGYFENALSKYTVNRPEVIPIPRILFNPEMVTVNFMVPGVTGLVLMIITTVLASGILVREKERGTMEHILVTPVSSTEVILGKLIPFLLIAYFEVFLVVGAGILIFEVPFKGSFVFLLFATFPYILTTLSIGLYASTISMTQQQAVLTAFMFMMPNILLSGFMFPIENMPEILQKLTILIPVKYYMTIVRGVFLKGTGLKILWSEILALFGFGIAFFLLSVSSFRRKLV